MGAGFTAQEIFEVAAQLERNGARFFRRAAEVVTDPAARDLLASLARMEDDHERLFATGDGGDLALGPVDGEVAAYLRALAVGPVHVEDAASRLSPSMPPQEVLRHALAIEKEAILYYQGLRILAGNDAARAAVDAIIREEVGHVAALGERLLTLGAEN